MRFVLTFFLGCTFIVGFAQYSVLDSIKHYTQQDSRFYVGLHNRNLVLLGEPVKLLGIVAGMEYHRKLDIFAGVYGLSRQVPDLVINDSRFSEDTVSKRLETQNISLGIDYTFFQKNRLSLSVPLQVGIGGQSIYYTGDSGLLRTDVSLTMPIESGVAAYFEVFKWVGIKGGVGYRLNLGKKESFINSSPYYNLGLAILLGELYRSFKD